MKNHSLYKWFRRVAMLSGIPTLTMMFACCCKYGMPNDWIYGVVVDEETYGVIPEVFFESEGNVLTVTDEFGEFRLVTESCINLEFSKEGYQAKDTMICTPQHVPITIKLQKQSEE